LAIGVRLALSLLAACGLAYLATPYAITVANRLKFYDLPVGYKGHKRPTPYLGGAAVTVAFVAALVVAAGHWDHTLPTVLGVGVLWVVGTLDDRRNVSPLLRVAVELALAALIWGVGLGWKLHAGALADLAATCVWTVAVINAFNLFDNMDGAASTMALVSCLGAAGLGTVAGHAWVSVGAVALAGACLGFLPRNLSSPARVFLGDGGSMPVGFAVAVLTMRAAVVSTPGWQALLVGLLLVGVPALDTCLVVVSRRRRGLSVLTGGRDHLTHRTHRFLGSARAVALTLGAAQALVSAVAILASHGGTSFVTIAAIVYLLMAAAAIVLLESRAGNGLDAWAEEAVTADGQAHASAEERLVALATESRAGDAIVVTLGLGAGLSPFAYAYYDTKVWVSIGLGLTALAAVGLIARPLRPGAPGVLALLGTIGMGLWALASAGWAEAVEDAVVGANRWLAYGALLVLAVTVARTARRARLLLAAAGIGVVVVAASVLVRLMGGDPQALFLGARLNSPLGYVNGEGCLFAIGFWLCFAAAESRRALLAGCGAAGATAMACLALLSQSRGTALAMAFSLVVVLALVPGRARRAYALILVGLALVFAGPSLLHVYDRSYRGAVSLDAAHGAARATVVAALLAGLVWTAAVAGWQRVVASGAVLLRARRTGTWLLAVPVVIGLASGVGSARRIDRELASQWRAFTHLAAPAANRSSAGQSRLLSGAGNRYDYWRIAWRAWRAHPLAGLGAGNYPRYYFQQRATTEDVEQPHSIELQALSDLGLVGGGLLGLLLIGAGWGAVRKGRDASRELRCRVPLVASVGAFAAWLAQTSVDWMHLLPGLTGLALIALAVIVMPGKDAAAPVGAAARGRPSSRSMTAVAGGRRWGALALALTVGALAVGGASLTRQGLAEGLERRAGRELAGDPTKAIKDADSSLKLDADALQTYYVKAAALARLGRAAQTEVTLRAALARQPESFVTWTLLGDVAKRQGDAAEARRDYARAHSLNPREQGL
jgi:UDP-GlcNAc:undecaprenyl-phosphate/decaprenyl-phosphate GlcNAc-1-phosphate transferase